MNDIDTIKSYIYALRYSNLPKALVFISYSSMANLNSHITVLCYIYDLSTTFTNKPKLLPGLILIMLLRFCCSVFQDVNN